MRNSAKVAAIALICGLICLVLAWQSVAISPVAAQEESTPTPTLTATPTATPGSSSEEVFRLGSGSTFIVQHSVDWGDLTIIGVLLILIYIVRFSNVKTRKN